MRLSAWLSPWALRQMEARLALSRDLVHARHFSGNAFLRRLHSPRPGLHPLMLRPSTLEAKAWAERWRHASEDADTAALADSLDKGALDRLQGFVSTDLLAGVGVAVLMPDAIGGVVAGVVTTAVVFLGRKALQAIARLPQEHRTRQFARLVMANLTLFGAGAAVAAIFGVVLVAKDFAEPGEIVAGIALILPGLLFAAALAWRIAAYIELVAALPFQWREAVDRLELDRFVNSRALPTQGPPFGTRLGFADRLRAIRPALALQAREVAQRERPPRARPFVLFKLLPRRLQFTNSNGKLNWTRLLWFGAWIVFVIMRYVLHASRFGG